MRLREIPATHEFGHILGLDDKYNTQTNQSFKGWEQNMMGKSIGGKVETRNIEELLEDAFKEYDKWIKNHNPKKEKFYYEINP